MLQAKHIKSKECIKHYQWGKCLTIKTMPYLISTLVKCVWLSGNLIAFQKFINRKIFRKSMSVTKHRLTSELYSKGHAVFRRGNIFPSHEHDRCISSTESSIFVILPFSIFSVIQSSDIYLSLNVSFWRIKYFVWMWNQLTGDTFIIGDTYHIQVAFPLLLGGERTPSGVIYHLDLSNINRFTRLFLLLHS